MRNLQKRVGGGGTPSNHKSRLGTTPMPSSVSCLSLSGVAASHLHRGAQTGIHQHIGEPGQGRLPAWGRNLIHPPKTNGRTIHPIIWPPESLSRCSKGNQVSHVTRAPALTLANAVRALKRVSPSRLRACLRYRGIGSEMRRRRAGYAEYDRSSPCADKRAAHGETRDERSSRRSAPRARAVSGREGRRCRAR